MRVCEHLCVSLCEHFSAGIKKKEIHTWYQSDESRLILHRVSYQALNETGSTSYNYIRISF